MRSSWSLASSGATLSESLTAAHVPGVAAPDTETRAAGAALPAIPAGAERSTPLKFVKQAALRTFKSAGGFELAGNSRWRRNRLLILAYHGVAIEDEHLWSPELYFSSERLRERFEILRRGGYNVLPFDDAVHGLRTNSLPPRAVTLTFDDGSYDFYRQALPLLREFGFPATVYLTTYYSEYNVPVFPVACAYVLWKARGRTLSFPNLVGRPGEFDLSSRGGRERAFAAIIHLVRERRLSAEAKNELLQDLAISLGVDYRRIVEQRLLHLMSPDEVRQLEGAGVDVQLHTHRHQVPTEASRFIQEIEDNRRVIQAHTGRRAVHFCYPSGVFRRELLPWLREADVVSATTCVPSLASRDAEVLLLPRLIDTPSLSAIEFEGWLAGVSHFLPQRRYWHRDV